VEAVESAAAEPEWLAVAVLVGLAAVDVVLSAAAVVDAVV